MYVSINQSIKMAENKWLKTYDSHRAIFCAAISGESMIVIVHHMATDVHRSSRSAPVLWLWRHCKCSA